MFFFARKNRFSPYFTKGRLEAEKAEQHLAKRAEKDTLMAKKTTERHKQASQAAGTRQTWQYG